MLMTGNGLVRSSERGQLLGTMWEHGFAATLDGDASRRTATLCYNRLQYATYYL